MVLLLGIPHAIPLIEQISMFPPKKSPSLCLGLCGLLCCQRGKKREEIFLWTEYFIDG